MEICAAVIGAGSWGTTVAHLLAHNTSTVLWARDAVVAAAISHQHTNSRYLAGHDLHPNLRATDSFGDAVRQADLLVMGVPSHGFRSTLEHVAQHLRPWVPVVSLTKGLEQGSRLRMTEVINDVLPGHPYGVLTGPNLAKEILAGDAAATVLAMSDATIADELQCLFANRLFRVYTNSDVIGCEVAGALKNVMAIASGMADGLGTGDNTRAAVITRGLAELTRRSRRHGRPRGHLHLDSEPQPPRRRATRPGPDDRRDHRRDAHGGRGGEERLGGDGAVRAVRRRDAHRPRGLRRALPGAHGGAGLPGVAGSPVR
jgi:glycerol-3-phosphate dehydrogenase (NAD(P)+)